jgi:nucleoside-diphosphate-sugar epimerase
MNILILGGTGFIGQHVARLLCETGHAVTVFHRGQTQAAFPAAVRFILGDRDKLQASAAALRGLAPEVVIDVNPYTEQEAISAVRVLENVARRYVALSSGDVYRRYGWFHNAGAAPPETHSLTEEAQLREELYPYRAYAPAPDHLMYNYEKILVERAVMGSSRLAGTVLRLPMVYGPGDRQHRLFPYLKRMDDGRPAILLDERQATWRCTRGHVENVAAAVARAATDERAAGQIYNVGEPDALSEAEWVALLGRVVGWGGRVVRLPPALLPQSAASLPADWGHHLNTNTSRLREQLGFTESVSREEGLRRTVSWERANPPAEVPPGQFDYAAEDAGLEALRAQSGGPDAGGASGRP